MKKKGNKDTNNLKFVKWIILGALFIVTVFFLFKLTGLSVAVGTCVDSDHGRYPYNLGYVSGLDSAGFAYQLNDSCMKSVSGGDYVVEGICTIDNNVSHSSSLNFTCPYGCANGACLTSTPSNTTPSYSETNTTTDSATNITNSTYVDLICSNSDGGRTPMVKGNLSTSFSNGTLKNYFEDSCMIPKDKSFPDLLSPHVKNESCSGKGCMLEEFYCTGLRGEGNIVYRSFNYYCPSGCINGACINYTDTTCTDTDLGVDYYTMGVISSDYPHGVYGSDYCLNGGRTLKEWSCVNGAYTSINFTCPYSCNTSLGKCVNITSSNTKFPTISNWNGTGCSNCPNGVDLNLFGNIKRCAVRTFQRGSYLKDDGTWYDWGGTGNTLCEKKISECTRKCGWFCCSGATVWKWSPIQWRIKNI